MSSTSSSGAGLSDTEITPLPGSSNQQGFASRGICASGRSKRHGLYREELSLSDKLRSNTLPEVKINSSVHSPALRQGALLDYQITVQHDPENSSLSSSVTVADRRYKRHIISNVAITQHFNERLITPGEDVSLQCVATSIRPPRFVWERDGVLMSPNTDQRYTLGQLISPTGMGVVAHLNISRVRVEDGGMYSCVAVEGESKASFMARLDVYGPPYIRTLPPIKVQSGDALRLRCPYYGYPISKIEWEHKNKKLSTTNLPQHTRYKRITTTKYLRSIKKNRRKRKRRQIVEDSDGVLNIPRVSKMENGDSYTCIVYSPSGEMARRSFDIQVVEAPELDEIKVAAGMKEGQIVQIMCNIVSGDPPIYFSWLKDGKKIPPNLKITERSSDLFSVLIIKNVGIDHCGKYTCVATNHVGKVNQTSELYINVAPKWIEEPSNTSLLLGQRGAVYCNANGYPAPQIHWMKRDATLGIWRPILDLAGGGVMSLSNGTLIIEVVSLTDEGMYSCNVENGVGEPLNKNIWINVNKPVHFDSSSTNVTTKIGLPVSLNCMPLGDNPIRVKWSLDGKALDFSSSRITLSELPTHNGLKSMIKLNYVEARDGGTYECRSSNPYGVASHFVHLTILEPPAPPFDVQIDTVSSRTANISWRDTIREHVQYYTVQYVASDYSGWDSAKSVNVSRQDSDLRQVVELRDLSPLVDYRVRVASGNQVDLSHFTQPLLFTTHQEAPRSPPVGVSVWSPPPPAPPGDLRVSWGPPPSTGPPPHHGPLGYLVTVTPVQRGQEPKESMTKITKVPSRNGGKQEVTVTGLLKNTRYAITICAYNSAGNGPYSMPVYQTTREGAPETAPTNVECRGITSTSLRVFWQPITEETTSLLGYYIYYSTEDGSWSNITSPHTEMYVQSLNKYTNYTIKVAGYSNHGTGPFSQTIICSTLQDVPGPPSAIKVLISSPSSLLVSWKRPEQANGEITHYTVYVKPSSSTTSPQAYRVEIDSKTNQRQSTHLVKGLLEGGQYEIWVTASTRAGEGASSNTMHKQLSSRVVAGVSSLGGVVSVGVGSSLLLVCECVGVPPPRTVWYHQHNIITHHPRFTRNHDDSLLINNIDQSLSGNYTCLAKNLYGSDSVSYTIMVLPTPDPPKLRATSHRNAIHLVWDNNYEKRQRITYNLTWREHSIHENAWSESKVLIGVHEYTAESLKCGTKYYFKMTASNNVGTSQPAEILAATLGGVPLAPSSTEWFWSNSSHIFIQLTGWEDNGCDIIKWVIDYREYGEKTWRRSDYHVPNSEQHWSQYGPAILPHSNSFVIPDLTPARWYQIRVTVDNLAGTTSTVYSYATTTLLGETIGPPSDFLDLNMLVIIFSSILLAVCFFACIYILVKRHSQTRQTEYRNSLTAESKSERSNATVNTPQSTDANRIYSTPLHISEGSKHELYEISPYAQFSVGFRTFGHVENQEAPRLPGTSGRSRYNNETSFQMRSESEESDSISRTTTMKSVPRKPCRAQHHNR